MKRKVIFCRAAGPLEFYFRNMGFRITGVSDDGATIKMEGAI